MKHRMQNQPTYRQDLLSRISAAHAKIADRYRIEAAHAFAKINGWEVNEPFGLNSLQKARRMFEYLFLPWRIFNKPEPIWFTKGNRPVAILGQPDYDGDEIMWDGKKFHTSDLVRDICSIEESSTLKVCCPPAPLASFFAPGKSRFLLFVRWDTQVKWLPEQCEIYGPCSTPEARTPEEVDAIRLFDSGEADVLERGVLSDLKWQLGIVRELRGTPRLPLYI